MNMTINSNEMRSITQITEREYAYHKQNAAKVSHRRSGNLSHQGEGTATVNPPSPNTLHSPPDVLPLCAHHAEEGMLLL